MAIYNYLTTDVTAVNKAREIIEKVLKDTASDYFILFIWRWLDWFVKEDDLKKPALSEYFTENPDIFILADTQFQKLFGEFYNNLLEEVLRDDSESVEGALIKIAYADNKFWPNTNFYGREDLFQKEVAKVAELSDDELLYQGHLGYAAILNNDLIDYYVVKKPAKFSRADVVRELDKKIDSILTD